ncbi:MAG: hypothetical protein JF588_03705 [Caulobacterales bacterium]|nr:hypothetical protein [Caulobacterales bacterium]
MRHYIGPGLALAAGAALAWAGFGSPTWGAAAYGAGAIWWVIAAARSQPPLWRALLAVWVPAVAPLVLLVSAFADASKDDTAVLGFLTVAGPTTALLIASGLGAVVILMRMSQASLDGQRRGDQNNRGSLNA